MVVVHGQLHKVNGLKFSCSPEGGNRHIPTLTAVLPTSSDARLPCLLLMLRRLVLRGVRITALIGRGAAPFGDAGGETVILTTPGGIEIQIKDDKG